MSRLWLLALGSALVVAAAVLAARALGDQAGPLEWAFASALLFALALAVRLVLVAQRTAAAARDRSAGLVSTPTDELARRAVREERRRLDQDITRQLRTSLMRIADHAEAVTTPGRDAGIEALARTAAQIHSEAQRATSELRRQVGLVRQAADEEPTTEEPAVKPAARPGRTDILFGAGIALVAALEASLYPTFEGIRVSVPLICIAAASASLVLWRRTAPLPAAVALAGCYLAAWLAGQRVAGGFWCLVTVGGLLWAVGADSKRTLGRALVGPLVIVVIGGASWLADRDNALLVAAIALAGWLAGLFAGRARRRTERADAESAERAAALETARQLAVAAERQAFAREIHDVVSHAIGVAAVQSSAAEVLLTTDLLAAGRSLHLVAETARRTVAELDQARAVGLPQRQWTPADVHDLVERIRAAGTPVRLRIDAWSDHHAGAIYRIVQESLTNVVRHARGARASVGILGDTTGLLVQVADDGAPDTDSGHARGYGLVGLAERVSAAGGTLVVGPGPSGGFRVDARLPLDAPYPVGSGPA